MNVVHNDPVHASHIICSQMKNVILLQDEERRIKIYRKQSGPFLLRPEPIMYNSKPTEVIILSRDHVEYDQIVRVAMVASTFFYYKQNESNLIITNLADHIFFHERFYCTIVIEEFFVYGKMRTLNIDFNAGEMIINLKELHLNVLYLDDISKLFEILNFRENIFYRYSN
uniref:Uncharacterized protein n=1 Tax=Romanomermis culicivorax TaxID=13658 RepID=A0A915KLA9_ROMCU